MSWRRLPENAQPRRTEIMGRRAWITYFDELWHPVTPDEAVWAKAIFDNGDRTFLRVEHFNGGSLR
jgi:hypothetical protein